MTNNRHLLSKESEKTAKVINDFINNTKIDLAIILGSGLSDLPSILQDKKEISYDELSAFPKLSVSGHGGTLHFGRSGANNVLMLEGRAHYYEKGDIFAMRGVLASLAEIKVKNLLVTNAAGGISPKAKPGDIVVLSDHISFTGVSPLFDLPCNERFVDLADAYSQDLSKKIISSANNLNIPINTGIYAWFCGPHFETKAEVQMAKTLNCSMVGMSTAPEMILATFLKINAIAVSMITNYAAGLSDEKLSHQHTLKNINVSKKKLFDVLEQLLVNKL